MKEIWKPVSGYEDFYEVSNLGRVRKTLPNKSKIMKATKTSRGYFEVGMTKSGKQKRVLVHRLVAFAFCKKPNGCDVVNHIDNKPTNNRADNLEWVTQKANVHHAASVGVITIRPVERSDGKLYTSICETVKDGFSKSCVCYCCQGKQKKHRGYTWRYVDIAQNGVL